MKEALLHNRSVVKKLSAPVSAGSPRIQIHLKIHTRITEILLHRTSQFMK